MFCFFIFRYFLKKESSGRMLIYYPLNKKQLSLRKLNARKLNFVGQADVLKFCLTYSQFIHLLRKDTKNKIMIRISVSGCFLMIFRVLTIKKA